MPDPGTTEGWVIEDARARQRRHRTTGLAVLLAATGAIGTMILGMGGGGRSGAGSRRNPHGQSAGTAHAQPTVAARSMEAEYAIGLDGPNGLVVASRHGVFRTLDGGKRWSDIAPKILDGFYEHIDKIAAVGNRVWLELEGASVFDFLPYSFDGGRVWHSIKFSGWLSGLVFTNADVGWVTVTSPNGKRTLYGSTDGGANWRRSVRNSRAALPSIVGTTIPVRGAVPRGLRIQYAVRSPDGLAWAQAWGPVLGTFTPTYLLRSDNGGKTWASVTGP